MDNRKVLAGFAARREQVKAHYLESKSLSQTAKKFGITPGRVWQIVKGYK